MARIVQIPAHKQPLVPWLTLFVAHREAIVRKEGDCLSVEPVKRQTLLGLLAGWDALEDELPEIEDTAPEPVGL